MQSSRTLSSLDFSYNSFFLLLPIGKETKWLFVCFLFWICYVYVKYFTVVLFVILYDYILIYKVPSLPFLKEPKIVYSRRIYWLIFSSINKIPSAWFNWKIILYKMFILSNFDFYWKVPFTTPDILKPRHIKL